MIYRIFMSKKLVSPYRGRFRFTRKKNKKYVFILKKYLPLLVFDIAVSTNKRMILQTAKKLLKNLPKDIWLIQRSMPFHQGKSDEDLRQFLKYNPDPTYYGIVIHDNNTGEVVNSCVVTSKTVLSGY